ncbi:hypothetical protein ACFQZQ_13030 [Lysobacter koreensis]|uniref:Cupin domain-containing protein n=1 Tax=Lysobacter koreensis TaxID=266122 RepID=A0ABW2YQN9_9GAMM
MKRSTAIAACVLAALALLPLAGIAQDLAVTAAKNAKVLLDNDKVRVIELQMAPGGKTGMHSHGDHVVYFVTGGEATQNNADGTSTKRQPKPGEVMWSGPVTHDTHNTGKAMVKAVIVELKAPASPP